MSAELIARLDAARRLEVQVGHITFIGECPSYAKLSGIIAKYFGTVDPADAEMAAVAINDWRGVTEADVVADGDPNILVPFNKELYDKLIRDRKDWWEPISIAITKSVVARQIKKEAEIKNSQGGMTAKRLKK